MIALAASIFWRNEKQSKKFGYKNIERQLFSPHTSSVGGWHLFFIYQ